MALIFLFLSIFFFLSLYYMLTLKICFGVFSGIFKARMLKLGIHMDNEFKFCIVGSRIGTPCLSSILIFHI